MTEAPTAAVSEDSSITQTLLLADIVANTHELAAAKGWSPKTAQQRLTAVKAELAELAAALDALEAASRDADRDPLRVDVAEEVFDVIWNLCDPTEILGLDLETACRA